jgi:hypothetical protein
MWQSASRRASVLNDPRMRSQRLIGNSNPRYRWHQYWKTEEELKQMKKPMYVEYTAVELRSQCLHSILHVTLHSFALQQLITYSFAEEDITKEIIP